MPQSSSDRVFAPDEVLAFTRLFNAPRELVWRMRRDPEHLVRWYGPEGCWLSGCEIDFHPGGKWRLCMSHAIDHGHWISGEYLEIHEPDRLVFTYSNDYDEHEMVVTLEFVARDGRTEMRFHQAPFLSVEERDGHNWGWHSSLDLLAAYLLRLKGSDGCPVGAPRRDGVAEDLIAARKRKEDRDRDNTAKTG